MFAWSDVRTFLSVHREGSFARAARRLRVDPTTVGRRVGALEADVGHKLFVRGSDGFTLTAAGERMLPAAERMEQAAVDVGRLIAEAEDAPTGRVRLTTFDVLAERVIAPMMPRFHERFPGIRLDVVCTPLQLDLLRGEADLALRVVRPSEASLRVRRVGSASERPYVARSLLASLGLDEGLTHLEGVSALVAFTDEGWATEHGATVVLRTSSLSMLVSAAGAGAGVAVLPDVIAARDPTLVALPGLGLVRERPLWLVMHRDLAGVARVRAVADFLAEALHDVPFHHAPAGSDGAPPEQG